MCSGCGAWSLRQTPARQRFRDRCCRRAFGPPTRDVPLATNYHAWGSPRASETYRESELEAVCLDDGAVTARMGG
jgi:hypothetical protein